MREVDLNKKVAKWICSLPDAWAYKRLASEGNRGQPDVTGCIKGIRIELEGKMPGGKETPLQKNRLEKWRKAGAITGIYYSFEEAREIVIGGLIELGKSVQSGIQNKS